MDQNFPYANSDHLSHIDAYCNHLHCNLIEYNLGSAIRARPVFCDVSICFYRLRQTFNCRFFNSILNKTALKSYFFPIFQDNNKYSCNLPIQVALSVKHGFYFHHYNL